MLASDRKTAPLSISHCATTERVLGLVHALDWPRTRVADVGAGNGHFSFRLGEFLKREKGLTPREHIFPCDLAPEHFGYSELECRGLEATGRLPFDDASVDVAVSIEVIEHVEDQFAFLRELARIVRPGGLVIVTTPNVLSLTSRVRALLWGFPELFDPLPHASGDRRMLVGHIHPITPYFLAFAAREAGLQEPRLTTDRMKRSALAWWVLLAPALLLARAHHLRRLRRKRPEILRDEAETLAALSGLRMLTGRTAILAARKALPAGAPAAEARTNGFERERP